MADDVPEPLPEVAVPPAQPELDAQYAMPIVPARISVANIWRRSPRADFFAAMRLICGTFTIAAPQTMPRD